MEGRLHPGLDEALLDGRIAFAVHNLKDVPSAYRMGSYWQPCLRGKIRATS
jgi:porphobilinogen deaminase